MSNYGKVIPIGKWIVCKREDGKEYDPRTATPVWIADVTSLSGYKKFNIKLMDGKMEYAFFESYLHYFKKRNIDIDALPITSY